MSDNMRSIIFIIILIGVVAVSNSVRMKVKTQQVIINSERSVSADYEQVALTFLATTNELIPDQH